MNQAFQGGAFIEKYQEYTELETLTTEIANDVCYDLVGFIPVDELLKAEQA